MTYEIVHKTTYKYKYSVSVGNHIACLTPRTWGHHRCVSNELVVSPTPATLSQRFDYYGNQVSLFTVEEPHRELVVESRSEVVIEGSPPWPEKSIEWEEAARQLPLDLSPDAVEAYQFVFDSPRIRANPELAEYARQSFTPRRPLAEALLDLTGRIYRGF